MKPPDHTFRSDFDSISEVTIINYLIFVIFLCPLLLFGLFSFCNFSLLSMSSNFFFFLFFKVLQWGGRVVFEPGNFARCKISQPVKFHRLHYSSPALSSSCYDVPMQFAGCTVRLLPFHLPAATLRFLQPSKFLYFFLSRPFNRHLMPLIEQGLPLTPYLYINLHLPIFIPNLHFPFEIPISTTSPPLAQPW